jgi:hypothetical protein
MKAKVPRVLWSHDVALTIQADLKLHRWIQEIFTQVIRTDGVGDWIWGSHSWRDGGVNHWDGKLWEKIDLGGRTSSGVQLFTWRCLWCWSMQVDSLCVNPTVVRWAEFISLLSSSGVCKLPDSPEISFAMPFFILEFHLFYIYYKNLRSGDWRDPKKYQSFAEMCRLY